MSPAGKRRDGGGTVQAYPTKLTFHVRQYAFGERLIPERLGKGGGPGGGGAGAPPARAPPTTPPFHVRQYAFGERLIPERLGKEGVPDGVVAETWEISDYRDAPGAVTNGPHRGPTPHPPPPALPAHSR